MEQIEPLLEDALTKITLGEPNAMRQAEASTKEWEATNFPLYLYVLAQYAANASKPPHKRQLAGVLFRQTLDQEEKKLRAQRWLALADDQKRELKNLFLRTMADSEALPRSVAAQVVARVALIELPHKQWAELIPMLLGNMTNAQTPPHIKMATLDTLGFVCEEIAPEVLAAAADDILTAVIQGLQPGEQNVDVKKAACKALHNALNFTARNFENAREREIIMNVVMEATLVPNVDVAVAAYGLLNAIAERHYDKLAPSMQKLFKLTLEHIRSADENVAKQAVEFWCTVAEEEHNLIEDLRYAAAQNIPPPTQKPLYFIKGACQYLVPILAEAMTKRTDEEIDPDEMTLPIVAGICMSLAAQTVADDILPHIVPFIEQHITSQNWKYREAAVMAFGSILDGPRSIAPLITQATPMLINHMKDSVTAVKDTSAWTLGKIAKLHVSAISEHTEALLSAMVGALGDEPNVATNAAWCIHNLAASLEDAEQNPLVKYFSETVQRLLFTAEREDSDEYHLRTAAYEALNVVLATAPTSVAPALEGITKVILEKLRQTFHREVVSRDDVNDVNELQGLLCGVLQVITHKVGRGIGGYADQIMELVLRLFTTKRDSGVHEEAFLTVAAVADAVEPAFVKYMPDFHTHLYTGLQNWREYQVCSVAVGVVGDIGRAIGPALQPYCDRIITLLLQNLQNRALDRSVKPHILSCFGDVALAIGGHFESYVEVVMTMLRTAAQTVMKTNYFESEDYDLVDYMNQLREGILEAYTGIIQGLHKDKKCGVIFPHLNPIMHLIAHVQQDQRRSSGCARTACGIIADLVIALGPRVRQAVTQPFVQSLIQDTYRRAETPETKETAEFAGNILKKL